MNIEKSFERIKDPYFVALYSQKETYLNILIDTLKFLLKDEEKEVICLTWKDSAHDIHNILEKDNIPTDHLFFIDSVSIFSDFGLPYKNFDIVNKPDLIDDIWVAISTELIRRRKKEKQAIVILHNVSTLMEYMDINEMLMFLGPMIRQLRNKGANIIITNGININSLESNLINNLAQDTIEI
jgi:hypothetical protein